MAGLLQFFQLLLAELGAARRRGRGWSVGVVLLVLVLREVPAYVRLFLTILDAGETLRYLNVWPSVSSLYMSNVRRICKDRPANQNKTSAIQGRRTAQRVSIPWLRSRRRSP
jgi:hypothetical protein